MGVRKYATVEKEAKKATAEVAQIGDKVLVYPGPGQEPIEGTVATIDHITGMILEVLIQDKNKKERIIKTKDLVIVFAPTLIRLGKKLWRWIKKLF